MFGTLRFGRAYTALGTIYSKTISTATVEAVGVAPRQAGKCLSAASEVLGYGIRPIAVSRAIGGTVGSIGIVGRGTSKTIATATSEVLGTTPRLTSKIVGLATVATVGTVDRILVWAKSLVATVTATGLGIRPLTVGKVNVGTVATVGTAGPRAITRTLAAATVSTVGTVLQLVSKTIATATVSTVGTILATAAQILSSGVAVAATVKRDIFRRLTATVATVGTISDFLYDIVYAMNMTFRKIYAKVQITYTDPFFSAGVTTSADSVGRYTYTDQTVDNATSEDYKWFSLHRNVLDGTYHPLPGDQSRSVGWWGTVLSDHSTRKFLDGVPTLTIEHAAREVESMLVVGDDKLEEYPQAFTIKLFSNNPLVTTVDVGPGAANRSSYRSSGLTRIDLGNPAATGGTLTSVTIWANQDMTGLKVGTFYVATGNDYICRDYATIGNVTAGSAQTFAGLSIDVEIGDFIGCYFASGRLEYEPTGGDGYMARTGDFFDSGVIEYTYTAGILSIYATGTGNGDVLEHTDAVTGNLANYWTRDLSPTHTGIVKQTLQIFKWSRADAVSKIAQFYTTLEETYLSEDGDMVDLHVTEAREFQGTTIPLGNLASSEITVRLNNIDGRFDPGNTTSPLYGFLKNNRAIKAWLGVDLYPSGVRRWYPLGLFYSRDWNAPDAEIYAEVSGQDMLSRLQTTTYSTSQVYTGESLQDLAIRVMTDAGLTSADWIIDAGYDAITVPYAWFDQMTHREALRRIAAAALGQCYCDRDGKIVLDIYSSPSLNAFAYTTANVFEFDRPLAWTQMANYVEVQAAPLVSAAEQDIVADTETFSVPAAGTITKTHFYIASPCVDVLAPVIVGGADVTVDSYTTYAWGILVTYANAGGTAEDVTSVTVRGKPLEATGSRVIVAQDTDSINQNGKQALPEVLTSEFWQSETRAQEVADGLLDSYSNPRRDLVMRARGNIAQLLGDRVTCMDSRLAGTTAQFGIVGQDVSYDGGLEILVTAQQMGARYYKELTGTVSTVGTIVDHPIAVKNLATATVSTVGTLTQRTGKILTGAVSTAGVVSRIPAKFDELEETWYYLMNRNSVWNTAWVATTADDVGLTGAVGTARTPSGTYQVYRRPISFDTTSIPGGATITAATLRFYTHLLFITAGTFDLVIQNGQPTYPHHPSEDGDYNKAYYAGDGGSVASSAITIGGWTTLTLNATGLTWIQKAGTTKLMLRTSRDIAGTAPSGAGTYSYVRMGCPYVGETPASYLEVVYT